MPTMSATRLTETQWMVLSAASQRDDHCAMLPPSLKKLIDLGLIETVGARGDLPVWRRERPLPMLRSSSRTWTWRRHKRDSRVLIWDHCAGEILKAATTGKPAASKRRRGALRSR
jgi:hypothetical protein